jgi:hypothetical protein
MADCMLFCLENTLENPSQGQTLLNCKTGIPSGEMPRAIVLSNVHVAWLEEYTR